MIKHTFMCMYVCMHISNDLMYVLLKSFSNLCVYVCMRVYSVCMHVFEVVVHDHLCICHCCMYVCIYMCIYVPMVSMYCLYGQHACMYVWSVCIVSMSCVSMYVCIYGQYV
jgi:hypothetical protein